MWRSGKPPTDSALQFPQDPGRDEIPLPSCSREGFSLLLVGGLIWRVSALDWGLESKPRSVSRPRLTICCTNRTAIPRMTKSIPRNSSPKAIRQMMRRSRAIALGRKPGGARAGTSRSRRPAGGCGSPRRSPRGQADPSAAGNLTRRQTIAARRTETFSVQMDARGGVNEKGGAHGPACTTSTDPPRRGIGSRQGGRPSPYAMRA